MWLQKSKEFWATVSDLEGNYLYVNQKFLDFFAHLDHDFIGRPAAAAVYPTDLPKVKAVALDCLATPNVPHAVRFRKPRKDRSASQWIEWEFTAALNDAQQPWAYVAIGFDLSEKEAHQREASELHDRLQRVLHNMKDGYYELDQDWKVHNANTTMESIAGLSAQDLEGQELWDLFPGLQNSQVGKQLKHSMENFETLQFEDRLSPSSLWVSIISYPIDQGLAVVIKDLSEQKKAEAQLNELEQIQTALFNSTQDPYLVLDLDFKILFFNRAANEMAVNFYGQGLQHGEEVIPYGLPGHKEEYRERLALCKQGELQEYYGSYDGRSFQFILFPVYDEQGQIVAIGDTSQDVTEIRESMERIKAHESKLSTIAAHQSHQVRAPLASMMALISELQDYRDKMKEEEIRQYLSHLQNELQRLDQSIKATVGQTKIN